MKNQNISPIEPDPLPKPHKRIMISSRPPHSDAFGSWQEEQDYRLLERGGLAAWKHVHPKHRETPLETAIARERFHNEFVRDVQAAGVIASSQLAEVIPFNGHVVTQELPQMDDENQHSDVA